MAKDEKCQVAKKFLLQVELYDVQINRKQEHLDWLNDMVHKITATLQGDVVSGSGSKDKLGDTTSKIVDLKDEINRDIDALIDRKMEISSILDKIGNPDFVKVLHKRYFKYMSWSTIACEMNMSDRQAQNIHGDALKAFYDLMEGNQ